MNERNHWITFANNTVVGWCAFLPPPSGGIEAMIRFGTAVVEAGERYAVYRAVRLPALNSYEIGSQSFDAYLRAQARERGRVPMFPEDPGPGPELMTPARIAFYRGDTKVEEEVGDVGDLLRELRPDRIETCGMFMRGTSPVTVLGGSFPLDWTREARILVRLDTDIWFPYVMGMIEDFPEDGDKPDMYDNRELAGSHTPRLNAFLREVRQVTLDLGGRWSKLEVEGVAVNYANMWNELGILL